MDYFEKVEKYFKMGFYEAEDVMQFVKANRISMDDYNKIVNPGEGGSITREVIPPANQTNNTK